MAELSTTELHEALFGTWTAVARIAELLIRRAVLSEDEMGSLLTAAETTATDRQSRVGIAIVRDIIESAVRQDARSGSTRRLPEAVGVDINPGIPVRFDPGWPSEQAGDCRMPRPERCQAAAYPIIKGSDFDDAALPNRPRTRIRAAEERAGLGHRRRASIVAT